ncbi:putative membrane protein (plasmid) [Erwinia amylovora LA635]|uniref:Putative membrane protein n=1 Tax=Erwinia amylovora TaxID=552 RepID=A0A0P0ZGY5_ERWAM|nr:putative membrane protein [Erwinia amylovora LA635]CDK23781.1 hypothetical protein LA636_p1003 [Erwinia amylovora LA636]CDK23830.1 hypothetical protein LA637_p1003 [Erwinia amylovora LA637]CDM08129.1 putative membrane protein [Erwinia amylovora]
MEDFLCHTRAQGKLHITGVRIIRVQTTCRCRQKRRQASALFLVFLSVWPVYAEVPAQHFWTVCSCCASSLPVGMADMPVLGTSSW